MEEINLDTKEKQSNESSAKVQANNSNKGKIAFIVVICILVLIAIIVPICTSNSGESNKRGSYYIGDTVKNSDGVYFTVTKVENTQKLGGTYFADTTSANFIVLNITVKNNSNKQISVYGGCVDLYNSKGIKYEYYSSLNVNYIISEDIGVGLSRSFQIAFETPTTTKQELYTAKIGYSIYTADSKRVSIILNTLS